MFTTGLSTAEFETNMDITHIIIVFEMFELYKSLY